MRAPVESVRDDTSDRFYVLRRDISNILAEENRTIEEQRESLRQAPVAPMLRELGSRAIQ